MAERLMLRVGFCSTTSPDHFLPTANTNSGHYLEAKHNSFLTAWLELDP